MAYISEYGFELQPYTMCIIQQVASYFNVDFNPRALSGDSSFGRLLGGAGGSLGGIRLFYSNNDETQCNNNEQEIEERNRVWKDYLQERLIFYIVSFCIGLLLAWTAGLLG